MIDIHSHLIYGVDDGSNSLETSINILENYSKKGITDIILTPHYITESRYTSTRIDNYYILKKIEKELKNRGININIYLGNEIFIDNNIYNLVIDGKISTLNNSRYILIELPMSGIYSDYIDIFSDLIKIGFKVVLAHPERYNSFQKDYSLIKELNDLGVLFQCNLGSYIGEYGKEAKKTIKMMSNDKLISFIGTDIHREKNYSFINKGIKKMAKYYTKEELDDILINNPKNILKK